MNFDYMNDTHIDFWVPFNYNQIKFKKKTEEFALSLIPDTPSRLLIIGGDLGHYNLQNYWFLDALSSIYEHILLVFGNHDYYLVSNNQKKKYKYNSLNRVTEMKELIKDLPVTYLEGSTFTFDGAVIGGTGMWYDFQYGQQVESKPQDQVFMDWANISRDYTRIKGFTTLDNFEKEKKQLESIINGSDIIVSHVGPDWRFSPYKGYEKSYNSFYFFDGSNYRDVLRDKIWCFGHVHMELDMVYDDCRFISYALGYPDESPLKKFIQIKA